MITKRKDYIGWDEYFMGVALLSTERSKDPSTRVGACIVNDNKRIVSIGYNGMPNGIDDDDITWEREGNLVDTKYPYICHGELNAILNARGRDLTGCTIYVTLFPCNECAKAIIQSGINKIVYYDDKYKDTDQVRASKIMLGKAKVECVEYKKSNRKITLEL